MTDEIDLQKMARRLDKAFAESPDAAKAVLNEIRERHGRDTAAAALHEWQKQDDAARFEATQVIADSERSMREADEFMRLFAACPEAETAAEVCRIMAERGDPFAKSMHARFESRTYRLEVALTEAAVELHPAWSHDGDGTFTQVADRAPELRALVEWLYKTHPARARAVEQSIA
jgi:hypothetical protein